MAKTTTNMGSPVTLTVTIKSANVKNLVCFAALMWLSCAILFARSTESAPAKSGASNNGSNEDPSCATPNPASGYASPLKLPNSKREIKGYNVDYVETRPHKPVCLSKMADDAILWASGSSKKFRMKIYAAKDQDPHCGQHPFLKNPWRGREFVNTTNIEAIPRATLLSVGVNGYATLNTPAIQVSGADT